MVQYVPGYMVLLRDRERKVEKERQRYRERERELLRSWECLLMGDVSVVPGMGKEAVKCNVRRDNAHIKECF